MKRTLIAVCIGTLALSVGAYAEKQDKQASAGGNKGRRAAVSATRASGSANVQRSRQFNRHQNVRAQSVQRQHVSPRSFNRQQRTVNAQTNAQVQSRAINRQNRIAAKQQNQITARERNVRRNQVTANDTTVANTQNANRFSRRQALREQRAVNREQRVINRETNRNLTFNRNRNINRNVQVVNNWRGERFAGRDYYAFRNYRRAYHDRGWWHHHYGTSLTFVFGAPYFWSSGYWYPAWGYNPGYVYPYDGPIYGYGNLTPDQIVINVQAQLRDEGYYFGAIDGLLGPQTRQALAAFQADHGLAITSAVDEPTLASMGLV